MQGTPGYLLGLQKLASDSSVEDRDELLRRVSDLFFDTVDRRTEAETDIFGSVMERIAYEVEMEARARLAKRMAGTEHAPHGLIRRLAHDNIKVAGPVLERSVRLGEDDLVHVARTQGQDHLLAISGRQSLTPPVTDVIVERGSSKVLTRVAANEGARFSSTGLQTLSKRAASDDRVLSALRSRRDRPAELIGEIRKAVTERLKRELTRARRNVDLAELERMVAAKTATIDLDAMAHSNEHLARMNGAGQITEPMLTGFARARRLPETVRCLALLTGLNDETVSHCLLKAHLCALGVLCKANGFGVATYAALIQVRTTSGPVRGSAIAAAIRGYHALPRETARRMLDTVCEQAAAART